MTVQSDTFFCFGFGYVARHLAHYVTKTGGVVFGTTRSPQKAFEIETKGRNTFGVIFDSATQRFRPENNAHWIISIPPGGAGCTAYLASADYADEAASITYLSTTGVYGDRGGNWVFENTEPRPKSERAKLRVLAEDQWKRVGANIVRLPGIYGPGRSALERIRSGTAKRIVKPGQVFSRIHVDDIVSGLRIIAAHNKRRYVFHFCDDEPAPPQDVILHAAKLLGVAPPQETPIDAADLSAMARSFYAECKRVSNVATKLALDWQPQYPNYREGLAAIAKTEGFLPGH